MIMLVGAEEMVDQMILFSHHVSSSSSSPTSMLMMIQVKEYHLMMVGTDVVECFVDTSDNDALLVCC